MPRHVQGRTCALRLDSKSCRVKEGQGSDEHSSRSFVERAVRMRSQLMRCLRVGGGFSLHWDVEEDSRVLPELRAEDQVAAPVSIKSFVKLF
jgi:hypothetical protein